MGGQPCKEMGADKKVGASKNSRASKEMQAGKEMEADKEEGVVKKVEGAREKDVTETVPTECVRTELQRKEDVEVFRSKMKEYCFIARVAFGDLKNLYKLQTGSK